MDPRRSVELQAELHVPRDRVYPLFATQAGLEAWVDEAAFSPEVGAAVRLRLGDRVGSGAVLAVDPPQHVSFSLSWEGDPSGNPGVVAFDAIDHGERTHLTLRHVGLSDPAGREAAAELWRHWFVKLQGAARAGMSARTGG